jgi:multicomponent Na+:H+ antiporter subunit F
MTPFASFLMVVMAGLLVAAFMCLYRISRGPTAPDRAIAIDILGTLVVGFCCVMAMWTGQAFYMSIGIAWALLSFIGAIALAKYLEGRQYDE